MDSGLKNKVAIITGGSDGLGRAAAFRLASEGARVAVMARRRDHLERTAADIESVTGAEILAVPGDVTSSDDCEQAVKQVLDRWGNVDILLNNAGGSRAQGFEDVSDEMWFEDFDLKVMGAVRMTRLVVPSMRRQRDGRIVNISTVGGKAPKARQLPTSASRAAGINLTKSLANQYAPDNIRINTVCIGLVRTSQMDRLAGGEALDTFYDKLGRERVPLGRVAIAEEFAELLAFLVSDRAAYITGSAINFDGGAGLTV